MRKLRRSAVAAPLIGFTILVRRGLIWKLYWSAGLIWREAEKKQDVVAVHSLFRAALE